MFDHRKLRVHRGDRVGSVWLHHGSEWALEGAADGDRIAGVGERVVLAERVEDHHLHRARGWADLHPHPGHCAACRRVVHAARVKRPERARGLGTGRCTQLAPAQVSVTSLGRAKAAPKVTGTGGSRGDDQCGHSRPHPKENASPCTHQRSDYPDLGRRVKRRHRSPLPDKHQCGPSDVDLFLFSPGQARFRPFGTKGV